MAKLNWIWLNLILSIVPETMLFTEFAIESVKVFNKTSTVPGHGNTTLKRSSRNYPKVFIEFELTDSLRKYDGEVKIFFSPLGNSRYILLPFKVYRQPMCNILNSEYRNIVMHDLHHYSNFPLSEDRYKDLCDLMPVGHYYVRNYSFDMSSIPRSFATGRYRIQLLFYKKDDRISCKGLKCQALFT